MSGEWLGQKHPELDVWCPGCSYFLWINLDYLWLRLWIWEKGLYNKEIDMVRKYAFISLRASNTHLSTVTFPSRRRSCSWGWLFKNFHMIPTNLKYEQWNPINSTLQRNKLWFLKRDKEIIFLPHGASHHCVQCFLNLPILHT